MIVDLWKHVVWDSFNIAGQERFSESFQGSTAFLPFTLVLELTVIDIQMGTRSVLI